MSDFEYKLKLALGGFASLSIVTLDSLNPDVDPGGEEDMWYSGGIRNYLTVAETLTIDGNSVADQPGGTGARTLLIKGLDASYLPIEEIIDCPGNGTVVTVNSYLRFLNAYVLEVGSARVNNSDIQIYPTITGIGSIQALIAAGLNKTYLSHYTIPSGFQGAFSGINGIWLSDLSDSADITIYRRVGENAWIPFGDYFIRPGTESVIRPMEPIVPIFLPPTTDIKLTIEAQSQNTLAYLNYNIILEDLV